MSTRRQHRAREAAARRRWQALAADGSWYRGPREGTNPDGGAWVTFPLVFDAYPLPRWFNVGGTGRRVRIDELDALSDRELQNLWFASPERRYTWPFTTDGVFSVGSTSSATPQGSQEARRTELPER